jgi:putative lipoprotein (rSAM/lipoprotein system)
MLKNTYRCLIKSTNWILAGVLSVLGFSSCDIENHGQEEYGTPYATFTFRGKVTDEAGKPVKDVKIEVMEEQSEQPVNPVLTNASGDYTSTFQDFPMQNFRVIASDIDGETNGSFQNDTVQVKISKEDFDDKGNGNWNQGSATKVVNFVLKENEYCP